MDIYYSKAAALHVVVFKIIKFRHNCKTLTFRRSPFVKCPRTKVDILFFPAKYLTH